MSLQFVRDPLNAAYFHAAMCVGAQQRYCWSIKAGLEIIVAPRGGSKRPSKTQQRFVVRILDVLEEHNKNSGKAGSAPQARN
jgi:hypothetical protein